MACRRDIELHFQRRSFAFSTHPHACQQLGQATKEQGERIHKEARFRLGDGGVAPLKEGRGQAKGGQAQGGRVGHLFAVHDLDFTVVVKGGVIVSRVGGVASGHKGEAVPWRYWFIGLGAGALGEHLRGQKQKIDAF